MDEWRKTIQAAALAARENPFINMSALARDAGWSQTQIQHFYKDGSGEEAKVRRLGEQLRRLGVLSDVEHVLADQLRLVAAHLDSRDIPREGKRSIIEDLIQSLNRVGRVYLSALEKSEEDSFKSAEIKRSGIIHGAPQ